MSRAVPRVVRIVALLHFVSAAFSALVAIMAFSRAPADVPAGVASAVIAVAMVVLGIGLRSGSPAARTVAIGVHVLAFLYSVFLLANGFVSLTLLLSPAIVWELWRDEEVRSYFGVDRR